jgi:hypothetical protein
MHLCKAGIEPAPFVWLISDCSLFGWRREWWGRQELWVTSVGRVAAERVAKVACPTETMRFAGCLVLQLAMIEVWLNDRLKDWQQLIHCAMSGWRTDSSWFIVQWPAEELTAVDSLFHDRLKNWQQLIHCSMTGWRTDSIWFIVEWLDEELIKNWFIVEWLDAKPTNINSVLNDLSRNWLNID